MFYTHCILYTYCIRDLYEHIPLCMPAAGNLSLIRNRSFILLALVYAVNMAIVITWQTLIDEFLDTVGFSISKVVSMKPHCIRPTTLFLPSCYPACQIHQIAKQCLA
jgi:hypothetical protein